MSKEGSSNEKQNDRMDIEFNQFDPIPVEGELVKFHNQPVEGELKTANTLLVEEELKKADTLPVEGELVKFHNQSVEGELKKADTLSVEGELVKFDNQPVVGELTQADPLPVERELVKFDAQPVERELETANTLPVKGELVKFDAQPVERELKQDDPLPVEGELKEFDTQPVEEELKKDDQPTQPVKRGRGRPPKSETRIKNPQSGPRNKPSPVATKLKRQALPLNENIDPALFDEPPPPKRQRLVERRKSNLSKAPKPLFSAQALRSNFNPLPKTVLNYSSPEDVAINPRCGNSLNSLKFEKFEWLKGVEVKTQSLLIFGAGDMGQMGLGSEKLDDVRKPAIHSLIEDLRVKNEFAIPVHLAAGGMHTLVIDSNGRIWSWGINDNAALGRQTEGIEGVEQEELETRPMTVLNLFPQVDPNSGCTPFKAARVSAGDSVSVAISEQGELVAWGSFRSNDGLLGFDGKVGTSSKQLVPTRVSNLSAFPVAQIVCGYDHVLALTTTGHVYSWGNGQQQQLGRKIIERRKKNGLSPERLALKKIVLIGSGGSHSFAVNQDGLVYGWGLNTRGQLGISSEETVWEQEIVSMPTLIRAMNPENHDGARVVAIEGGDFHTLFLLSNGQVWVVGSYENSEIGIKSSAPEIVAIEKEREEGLTAKEAFVAKELKNRKLKFEQRLTKYIERTKDKTEQAEDDEDDPPPRWDEINERSEIEQEAAIQGFVPGRCLRTPIRLEFPHPIIDISCGTRHNLAVDNQGNAYSWGLGQSNELGQGKDEDGKEIELVESPQLLTSKALNQANTEQSKLKVIHCAAGGTHSLLLALNVSEPKTNGTS